MKRLYYTTYADSIPCHVKDGADYVVLHERLTHKRVGWILSILWNIATLGRVWYYYVTDSDSRVLHYSYVVRGRSKFSFLKKNDIEIGPCKTKKACRGKNLYGYVLYHIISTELQDGGKAYMIVDDNNMASQKGIEKVGFKVIEGSFVTTSRLKRYFLVKNK